jgi:hypothetical protein
VPDDLGVVLLAVGERRRELAAVDGFGDDVVVGDDMALGVEDEARAGAARPLLLAASMVTVLGSALAATPATDPEATLTSPPLVAAETVVEPLEFSFLASW